MRRLVDMIGLALVWLAMGCGENLTPLPADPGGGLTCLPDLDGEIVAGELPVLTGVGIGFAISPPDDERAVDVEGTVDGAGGRFWDWSVLPDDPVVAVRAEALDEQWFADRFPGGEVALPLDPAGELQGVYRADDQAVELLGFASATDGAGRTLVVYDAPVAIYRFPLTPGASWTSVGVISEGTLSGLPFVGEDRYDVTIDAAGELALPDVSFEQALRVRTSFARVPSAGTTVSRRQVSFVFECFGEVARATSRAGEPEEDFTVATEVRRIVLGAAAKEP